MNNPFNLPRIKHGRNTDEENHKGHEGHKDDGHECFPLVVFVLFVVLFVRTTNFEYSGALR